jgi:hypothetical protein
MKTATEFKHIQLAELTVSALLRLREWHVEALAHTGTDRSYERAIVEIDAALRRKRGKGKH